eukprot:bmy_12643T0
MIIYWDLISHDEMFSDIYKIRKVTDGLVRRWRGRWSVEQRVTLMTRSLVEMHPLKAPRAKVPKAQQSPETSFTKEANKKHIKDYMKSIKGKLEEQRPERVKPFMTGAAEQIKHILANFKNDQFFIGENMNPDGMAALLDYREDSMMPYMTFFKDGLEMEKC